MAILIKPNYALVADKVRRGQGQNGPWELLVVKDSGKSRKTVSVWPVNVPSGVAEGGQFVLTSIDSVRYGSKRKNEQWFDDVSITGAVRPLESYGTTPAIPGAFQELADDGDLPF